MAISKGKQIVATDLDESALTNFVTNILLNEIYPIGSIYMSVNNVSPASFLGGTWETLQDRFLIGAGNSYAVNGTGGASSHTHTTGGHTLTTSEIPAHTHGEAGGHTHSRGSMDITGALNYVEFDPTKSPSGSGAFSIGEEIDYWQKNGASVKIISTRNVTFNASKNWTGATSSAGGHTHSSVGGGGSHSHGNTGSTSNIPPYLAVYMWKRTA